MPFFESHLVMLGFVATIVVLALAGYAGTLLYKLQKQNARVQSVKQARREGIFESLEVIANATLQQQCSISEAIVRIKGLLDALADEKLKFVELLPQAAQFHSKIQHHPILSARKKLSKVKLQQLDADREELEAKWEHLILHELEQFLAVLKTNS